MFFIFEEFQNTAPSPQAYWHDGCAGFPKSLNLISPKAASVHPPIIPGPTTTTAAQVALWLVSFGRQPAAFPFSGWRTAHRLLRRAFFGGRVHWLAALSVTTDGHGLRLFFITSIFILRLRCVGCGRWGFAGITTDGVTVQFRKCVLLTTSFRATVRRRWY